MSPRPEVVKETAWFFVKVLPRALRGKQRDRKTGKLVPRPIPSHKTVDQLLEQGGRFATRESSLPTRKTPMADVAGAANQRAQGR